MTGKRTVAADPELQVRSACEAIAECSEAGRALACLRRLERYESLLGSLEAWSAKGRDTQ